MSKRTKWIVACGILAALAAGGVSMYLPYAREARWHEEAMAALTTRPTDIVFPEFVARIESAEAQARSGRDWSKGLDALASLYHVNGYT